MFSVEKSLQVLQSSIKVIPENLFILGSGWNSLIDELKIEQEFSYSQLFGVEASVPGHDGKFVICSLDDKKVALMLGRFHTYEGYSPEEVTRPLQVFAHLGVRKAVITSAAGALNESFRVGDFVILTDIITTFCPSPLKGPQFIDLSSVFSKELQQKVREICVQQVIPFQQGVYCYTRGPHFETPADKMLFHHLGADVIGMSTVPECIMAKSLDIEVLGLSFVTNLAFVKHDHHQVLMAAQSSSKSMVTVLKGLL